MIGNLPLLLSLLIAAFALAIGVAYWAIVAERQRRALLRRATGGMEGAVLLGGRGDSRVFTNRVVDWISARVPVPFAKDTAMAGRLVQAGFDGENAPAVYALGRLVWAVVCPAVVLLLVPRREFGQFLLSLLLAVGIGLLAPRALIDRAVARRQQLLRRGIPDALDLLVVCVEAGVALDAAMQRVSRELGIVHPGLAGEFVVMSRRVAAGMARDQAMHGLYLRTGLDELRGLSSHLIQSERWGTSIASVLRVYAEDLRRKRRLAAEKRAATASTRMLIPLALFIFPTIFIVLLGPAALQISSAFGTLNK